MENPKRIENIAGPRDKIILIPGTTFVDRIYALGKTKIQEKISSGEVTKEKIKEEIKKVLVENPEITQKVSDANPQNRFIANRGIESRLLAVSELFREFSSSGKKVEIYTTGGLEQNTVEENLYRAEIVKNRLGEVYGVPKDLITPLQSGPNTQGNLKSFLAAIEKNHDLGHVEVFLVTDERHLPRATVILFLSAYEKLHGTELHLSEEVILKSVNPLLSRFERFMDKDRLSAEETSRELLKILLSAAGDVRINIIPKSSAEVIDINATTAAEKKYAKILNEEPYTYPKRKDEVKGIKDLLSGNYNPGIS